MRERERECASIEKYKHIHFVTECLNACMHVTHGFFEREPAEPAMLIAPCETERPRDAEDAPS